MAMGGPGMPMGGQQMGWWPMPMEAYGGGRKRRKDSSSSSRSRRKPKRDKVAKTAEVEGAVFQEAVKKEVLAQQRGKGSAMLADKNNAEGEKLQHTVQ